MQHNSTEAWRREYPFQSHFLELGDHRLHYLDEGDDPSDLGFQPESSKIPQAQAGSLSHDKGTILMVHGNPTWSFYWRRLVDNLRHRQRVVAIDHLGCGLSDKPTDYDYCLENHIENLCTLIDKLDLKNVTLMAHDWGGSIGLGALLARRERFKRIVLFNTAAFPPPYIPFRIRVCRWPVIGKIGVQGLNLFARAAQTMTTEKPLAAPVAAGLIAPYDSWEHRVAIYNFVKDIPLSAKHRTWSVLKEIEAQLPTLADLPKMLMWGMKDWCFRPECLDRFVEHWPDAFVHRVEDAGHYVIEDAAEEVQRRVNDFFDEN